MGAKAQPSGDTQTFQHMGQPWKVENRRWGTGGDQG